MNYYEILGINTKASPEEIRAAYKKLAFRYHPDKNPGSEEAKELFQEINNAYEVLSNYESKILYDQMLYANSVTKSTYSKNIDTLVEDFILKEREYLSVVSNNRKSNLTISFVLWAIFSAFVWYATSPEAADSIANNKELTADELNLVVTVEDVNIYTKPNIKSEIKYTAKAGVEFTLLKKTKYFALVTFATSDTTKDKGYVLLEKIKSK